LFFLVILLELLDVGLVLLLLPLRLLFRFLLSEVFGFLLEFFVFLFQPLKHLPGVVLIGLLILLYLQEVGLECFSLFLLLLLLLRLNLFHLLFIFLKLELHLLLMFFFAQRLIFKHSKQHVPIVLLVRKFFVEL